MLRSVENLFDRQKETVIAAVAIIRVNRLFKRVTPEEDLFWRRPELDVMYIQCTTTGTCLSVDKRDFSYKNYGRGYK